MIDEFANEHAFLSNFHPSPVVMYGQIYPTVEHAFQAAKTLDMARREEIRLAPTPGRAKRLGRRVELRPDWDTFRLEAMETLLQRKFADPYLRERLAETWPHKLVEGNYWGDRFWGVCGGEGENHLGRLLMKIRDGALGKSGASSPPRSTSQIRSDPEEGTLET